MFCDVWDLMGTGPVKYLTKSWELLVDQSKVPHQHLLDYFLAIPNDWSEEVRRVYNDSAFTLAQSFAGLDVLDERITTLDVVRFWPIKNSVEFVELLEKWHPGALILLAHYCIVLHRVRQKAWYLKGSVESMLSTIARRLDITWHRYIQWPLQEIGISRGNLNTKLLGGSHAWGSDSTSSMIVC